MAKPGEVQPVEVTNTDPLPVALVTPEGTPVHTPGLTETQHVARQATAESDRATQAKETESERVTFGQRRINLVWEATQAVIAVSVTTATLLVAVVLTIRGDASQAAFLLLSNAFFLVVGFYFGRTNHARTGGVGPNDYGR